MQFFETFLTLARALTRVRMRALVYAYARALILRKRGKVGGK